MPYKNLAEAAYHAAYRATNRKRIAAYGAAYRTTNKERIAARAAVRRVAHRDGNAAYKTIYYAKNGDAIREKSAARRAANPHIVWVGDYRRRALAYGFTPVVEDFTRDDLIARYGDACAYCGGPFEQLDHSVPVRAGGPHTLDNVRPSCAPCNRAKYHETDRALIAAAVPSTRRSTS